MSGAGRRQRPPNRVLDLSELERPDYRAILADLDRLLLQDPISYLHPSKRWEYPWALEQAGLKPASRILDVGSGGSIFPVYLAAAGHSVTASDRVVLPRLDRWHDIKINYLQTDLAALGLGEAVFDAVFCISVIEHLPPGGIGLALAELRRVLVPGGKLLLTTDFYQEAAADLRYEGPGDSFPVDWHIFDEVRLRTHLLNAPGWHVCGELDLAVDWSATRITMRRFHGYPYTSVGVVLGKNFPKRTAD